MAEYILSELRKRLGRKHIGVFYDGHSMSQADYENLPKISKKLRSFGTIRTALFFTDKSPEKSNEIEESGYSIKVFPPIYSELSMSIEIYEKILFEDYDIVILAIKGENLLGLMNEIRSKAELIVLIAPEEYLELYRNLADEVLSYEEIEEFTLEDKKTMEVEEKIDAENNYIDQITQPAKINEQIEELSLNPVSEALVDAEEN